jgi:hypothetical protein
LKYGKRVSTRLQPGGIDSWPILESLLDQSIPRTLHFEKDSRKIKDFTSLILRLLSKASHQRGPAPAAWSGCHTRSQDGASFQGFSFIIFFVKPLAKCCACNQMIHNSSSTTRACSVCCSKISLTFATTASDLTDSTISELARSTLLRRQCQSCNPRDLKDLVLLPIPLHLRL